MDSDDCDVEDGTRERAKRTHGALETEFSGSNTEAEPEWVPKVPSGRRGKTARGTGLARARAKLRQEEAEAQEVAFDEALRSRACRKEVVNPTLDPSETEIEAPVGPTALSAEELRALAGRSTSAIVEVARKSGDLQGPSVKRLEDAAAALQEIVDTLAARPEMKESRRLRRDNGLLRKEVETLRAELAAHRREFDALKASMAAARGSQPLSLSAVGEDSIEELRRSIVTLVGALISARFEGIEERLLPPVLHRPPLAADRRKQLVIASDVEGAVKARPGPALAKPKPAKKSKTMAPTTSSALAQPVVINRDATDKDGEYTLVNRAKRKGKGKKSQVQTTAVTASEVEQKAARRVPTTRGVFPVKLTPPKSAAVVITLRQEAATAGITYAQVFAKAAASIKLADIGIESLNFRRAATGARVLELAKGQPAEKADQLAERFREVLDGVVRVNRPTKCAEMRISGLEDSATKEMVVEAVAHAGGCSLEAVKAREIRTGPGGMGAVVVQCPVTAAKPLVDAGKILVGWCSARVEALKQRPMRCFKCMGIGHTRPVCTSEVDRGSLCFRCGREGHRAAGCTDAPKCAVCADAGRPSGHQMGGLLCNPPHQKKGKADVRPSSDTQIDGRPQAQVEGDMSN